MPTSPFPRVWLYQHALLTSLSRFLNTSLHLFTLLSFFFIPQACHDRHAASSAYTGFLGLPFGPAGSEQLQGICGAHTLPSATKDSLDILLKLAGVGVRGLGCQDTGPQSSEASLGPISHGTLMASLLGNDFLHFLFVRNS